MIQFFSQDIDFEISAPGKIISWINKTFQSEKLFKNLDLSIIFNSDEALLGINKQFLNHDYYTDIITFTLDNTEEELEAELYISIDRVKDNAQQLNKNFEQELNRVIIHGVLHLCGYGDKTEEEEKLMRAKEDAYLNVL